MKYTKIVTLSVLIFCLFFSSSAFAHYLWMDTIGPQEHYVPGTPISIDVYLHAEIDDAMNLWSIELGFDDTNIDGAEVTYNEIIYGDSTLGVSVGESYKYALSLKHPGESVIWDITRDGLTTWQPLSADEDFLLFTAKLTFDGGTLDGKEDVWLEFEPGIDGFAFRPETGEGFCHTLEIYTDNTKTTLLGDNGPDFAPVPIPGAILLLGPAFLGFIGLRRKKR